MGISVLGIDEVETVVAFSQHYYSHHISIFHFLALHTTYELN